MVSRPGACCPCMQCLAAVSAPICSTGRSVLLLASPEPALSCRRPPAFVRRSTRQRYFGRTAAVLLVLQMLYTANFIASFALVAAQPNCERFRGRRLGRPCGVPEQAVHACPDKCQHPSLVPFPRRFVPIQGAGRPGICAGKLACCSWRPYVLQKGLCCILAQRCAAAGLQAPGRGAAAVGARCIRIAQTHPSSASLPPITLEKWLLFISIMLFLLARLHNMMVYRGPGALDMHVGASPSLCCGVVYRWFLGLFPLSSACRRAC